jgi:hypothetical protein
MWRASSPSKCLIVCPFSAPKVESNDLGAMSELRSRHIVTDIWHASLPICQLVLHIQHAAIGRLRGPGARRLGGGVPCAATSQAVQHHDTHVLHRIHPIRVYHGAGSDVVTQVRVDVATQLQRPSHCASLHVCFRAMQPATGDFCRWSHA